MHVQSCCFAYKTYCFLTFSSPSASLDLKVPIYYPQGPPSSWQSLNNHSLCPAHHFLPKTGLPGTNLSIASLSEVTSIRALNSLQDIISAMICTCAPRERGCRRVSAEQVEIKRTSSLEILKKSLIYKYFLETYKDVHHFTIAKVILLY